MRYRAAIVSATLLAAPMGGYVFLPRGTGRDAVFAALGLACVAVAALGLLRQSTSRKPGWLLVVIGFGGWVTGDAVLSVQEHFGFEGYPGPADAVYLVAYALMTLGVLVLVRQHGQRTDVATLLDATIVATGVAVVAGVFVIVPIAQDSTLTVLGKLTSGFYPTADIVLLGMLVRFAAVPSARHVGLRLLTGALLLVLAGDVYFTATTIITGSPESQTLNDVVWYAGYVLLATSAWAPVEQISAEPAASVVQLLDTRRRLVLLTGGLMLPALTLLVDGLTGGTVGWPIVVAGSLLLSLLVLARMAGLLGRVSAQTVQLATLARSDALTGVPNRRTWDHELARACQTASRLSRPLSVAILDLDHFKLYNDRHGHQAGDRLLREATARWVELLDGAVLARYGGEEFAVLFAEREPSAARSTMVELLAATPNGQTFSAGIARWDPTTPPGAVVAAADAAMYRAKRAGRNRIFEDGQPATSPALPTPTIAFQPIVDLATGHPVAVEALSRFAAGDPESVFAAAYESGSGPELEAAAIAAALEIRPRGLLLTVNLSIDIIASETIRRALAGDLRGVVLEVSENSHTDASSEVLAAVADYRSRGASIAIDDWPRRFSGMDRLLLLRPEVVKIDLSLVQALDARANRAAIASLVSWASVMGSRTCAEGIETEEHARQVRELGIDLGQGWLFGRPAPALPTPPLPAEALPAEALLEPTV